MTFRVSPAASRGSILAVASLTTLPAVARPHHHITHAAPSHARHAAHKPGDDAGHAARAAQNAIQEAAMRKRPDAQMLVTEGKLHPFYDPNDLSKSPILNAPSAILMDADTGQVLWSKNPDERRFPASTTKILTSLLFIEHTKPTDVITCLDPKVTQIEESSLHIKPWEKFTAQDLLYGTLLRSANDGAVVMAEHVAGSVPKFAELMNEKALALGATHSHFVTPNGLPEPRHYTTARDLALIARAAMQNPRFADAVGTPERYIQRSILVQDSKIVAKAKPMFYDKFPGADGVKTGYTRAAGHCFVGSATRDGRRLLTVVLGSRNSAITDTIPLLGWGFQRFSAVFVLRRGQVAGDVPVAFGARSTVPAVAAESLHASMDGLSAGSPVVPQLEPTPGLAAPIRQGQEVGKLVAKVGDKVVSSVPVVAEADVPRSGIGAALTRAGGGTSKPVGWIAAACGAALTLLIGFRYGPAAIRFASASSAPTKSSRSRRNRVASSRRGDYRIR